MTYRIHTDDNVKFYVMVGDEKKFGPFSSYTLACLIYNELLEQERISDFFKRINDIYDSEAKEFLEKELEYKKEFYQKLLNNNNYSLFDKDMINNICNKIDDNIFDFENFSLSGNDNGPS